MKLVTYQDGSGVHVGALRGDEVVALDSVAPDMLTLIDRGAAGLAAAEHVLATATHAQPLAGVRLLAPIPRPRENVICVGMNYVAHAIESDRARGREPKLPAYPVFFTKAVNTVVGTDVDFELDPAVTRELDYEVELAFIIGRRGKNIPRDQALAYIFGYTIANDISARDLQGNHQQFFKGKSLDGSCPLGPCIVTADEIPDPGGLTVSMTLNGERRQHSSTSDLIFDVPTLVAVLSKGMTIEPGTIVSTGTPSGVGLGYTPPQYMQAGDVMEAAIEGIGVLRTRVVSAA